MNINLKKYIYFNGIIYVYFFFYSEMHFHKY